MKRFQCQYPSCNRSYLRKEHLSRHQRDHTNLRQFMCHFCHSKFNRRDLLKRHIVLSHSNSSRLTPRPEYSLRSSLANAVGDCLKATAPNNERCGLWASSQDVPTGPTLLLLETPHQKQLTELYFRNFHGHWPILHQQTFRNTTQPPKVMQAVLTVGLWTVDEPETRSQAGIFHDAILRCLDKDLFNVKDGYGLPRPPRQEYLPDLQAFTISLGLTVYRGIHTFPSSMINGKHLGQLFHGTGVFDQERIDAENLNPVTREQYQRLALALFKIQVHLNSLLVNNLPQFKPFEYLAPRMLNVRVPSPERLWEGDISDLFGGNEGNVLISSMFLDSARSSDYKNLSLVIAWDFTLGMVLGCFLTRHPGETYVALIQRITPFLDFHITK
ncbi:Zinc finger protein [Trichoderma lentiforme]|uniref:Zinc finger protein n=1 Tax=Trichoderma lentiforme TaxID=1567552 RepID=A0A9P5C8F6_9HYPO|nr:Zinc finger protein [Trichoderma lentiforme]